MQVSPSSKVRDLCVVFDQYLTFHDHISGICKSTHFHLRGIGRILEPLPFDSYCIYIICMIFLYLQFVSTVIIVYNIIIISPLNSYLFIHWILDFK